MKKTIIAIMLLASFNAMATDERSIGAGGLTSNPSFNDGDIKNNLFVLPSTTSALATSGNVDIVCPLITAKSKAKQYAFGLYSESTIADEPAVINGVCVLYHVATRTGQLSDWQNLLDYSAKFDKELKGIQLKKEEK
jgi:hypothetical protein